MRTYTTPLGLIRTFEDQFEEDGVGGYLYRLNGKGRPIPVGSGERRRFINQYASRIFLLWATMMIAALLLFYHFYSGVIHSTTVLPSSVIFSDPFFYAGLSAIVLPTYALMRWLRGAPARALKGRASIGPEPTSDEVRANALRRITYPDLALIALVGAGSYSYIADGHWDRRWIFVPPVIVLVAAVQAFRKWRFERLHPDIR
jgi:hypothetical protein